MRFIMLVGIAGSGKSTYAENYVDEVMYADKGNPAIVIHSSDRIRKELWGDESIQNRPDIVFYVMDYRTMRDLADGFDVIYDATNLSRIRREGILAQVKKIPNVKCECVVLSTEPDECVQRDLKRSRTVGSKVIQRQSQAFQMPVYDEGWDKITIVD